ncbi:MULTISPECIES: NUDIX hydrolase N-terminal domain-containing protein [unclassified Facklamia]|uniref:NUDIX hydrolase n=1 Tax=Facklamia sp. 252 TaxID=2678501 RepID=UPI0013BB8E5F|nr:NUDIX domain-containing protein [Facklamia sp. 252]NEW67491.1 NUDIX domain-containing protein [Facklamia sp. 253]QQD65745.1 NUDIX hydrolase N-terminal domain-containing protein [Aerococcaceae bacterium zg-252]
MNKLNIVDWAKELHALAETGLFFTKDVFDKERFERIKQISFEMLAQVAEEPVDKIAELYLEEKGYQTPKVDTRAIVWRGDKLLLVQENDGLWVLPGGWMDVTQTISSNIRKEVFEEAGMEVEVGRLVAIHDRNIHNPGLNPFTILKIFVECQYVSGMFRPNSETVASGFFAEDEIPPLMERKTSTEQVRLAFEAKKQGEKWQPIFD